MALDQEWHKKQIELYKKEYETYKIYSKTLFSILQNLCDEIAPNAIVQTRPKEISSFAEKVVRKIDKYIDPVHQFTDLCGARIITHTQNEVERICSFIEKNFDIDRETSLDVKERLRINEFGYRSFHYIIKLPKEMLRGIEIPDEIGERKAEIQVKTILQHA
jgi:ppGpp synthetase/RelA/SpoT-type nucleotidyltranferase